ncbi:MAG: DUF4476 domain-containing protein [Ignavibacteria bacterium]|nr:DUF4476 domain-containing protein [Ignavibacteria bacterium]
MKSINTILFTVIIFISTQNIFSNYHDDKNFKNSDNYCNCSCDNCKDCRYKSPDNQTGYNDYRKMSNRDFAEFKQLIADRTFESTKMDMTKSVIDNNYFSTEQVKEILTWFVFESNKLELAKYVFKNTVDPYNYYKLYNSFVFESNVVELDNYIKNYR